MIAPNETELTTQLEDYLHKHIPISAAMGVRVEEASDDGVRLFAPLGPNINHRSTVFGGSAAAIGILAGWTLLHVRLGYGGRGSRIVIQRNTIEYSDPIDADFEAVARPPDAAEWERFIRLLHRRGRSRIDVTTELRLRGGRVGECVGTYVVLPPEPLDSGTGLECEIQ